MFPLFESIKIADGQALHLSWHQERMNRSYFQYFGKENPHFLEALIRIPSEAQTGIFKARFVYGETQFYWEFHPYQAKKIHRLKLVEAPEIDYSLKYTNRQALQLLAANSHEREEIIILQQNFVTDSSYSNLIFKSGDSWYTPDTPLLAGTCRARLLSENKISSIAIRREDLSSFSAAKLINAMLAPEDSREILAPFLNL